MFSCLILFLSCKKEQPQSEFDEKIIKDYITLNSIPAKRTSSGLYYIILDTTQNTLATFGKKVQIRYTARILNGAIIETNKFDPSPKIFTLGMGEVILGLDEGLRYVRVGENANFYIPSGLGFGPQSYGNAPPNTVLDYNVTLEGIQ